jgi:hypothetical protein
MRSRRIPKICRDTFFGWGAHLAQAAFEETAKGQCRRKACVSRRSRIAALASCARFSVEVPAGSHRIEVSEPGYRRFATEIDVQDGE